MSTGSDIPTRSRRDAQASLVISTCESLQGLMATTAAVGQSIQIAAALLVCASPENQVPLSADADIRLLTGRSPLIFCLPGDIQNKLGDLIDTHKPAQVIVCLPVEYADIMDLLAGWLDQRSLNWRYMPTVADQLAGRIARPKGAMAGGGSDDSTSAVAGAIGRASAGKSKITFRTPLWSVDPAMLLDRHPHPLDEDAIRGVIQEKTVLITGAGGSIGSELARLVGRFGPSKLVLVERSENALFEIDREIARRFPHLLRAAVLHDVTDAPRTLGMLLAHKPAVIFHAAAHKHVPMMEEHPSAAVENNFYGTRSIADAATKTGVERFVMISTDKAVRPSSVMGATKRLAERYIEYLGKRSDTLFSMVRFGNVLGSACSVLPIWAEQISRGGPITVTHPDMTRYFMTIPEAAGLVIQSAALAGIAGGGEVFLLDMGKPIRIVELAQRFVKSQGLEVGKDIAIDFTGIRPGEKLFEELAYESEEMHRTPHPSVRVWKSQPPDPMHVRHIIAAFDRMRGVTDPRARHFWQGVTKEQIMQALHWAIPEMTQPATSPLPANTPTAKVA